MTARSTTLIVGGYGSVGRVIATELATDTATLDATGPDGRVDRDELVLAGRDGDRAARVAAEIGEHVSGRAFDVTDDASYDRVLGGVDRVVVCLDLPDAAFAAACLERGIDYVDVTASDEVFREVEALDDVARSAGATAVLSVGLAPGVTNLLAARATDQLDAVDGIRIGVLLGLGEAFGPAASRWTLERIGREFTTVTADGPRSVRGFTAPLPMEFPRYGQRTAYAFDFADQHALARTLDVPVTTRLCFDSRAVSTALYGTARLGLYRPLVEAVGLDRLVPAVDALPGGDDGFAVTVAVDGTRDGTPVTLTHALDGREQSTVTGTVAATVVTATRGGDVPAGVHHVHEVIDPDTVLDVLRYRGYRVSTSERTSPRGRSSGGN